MNNQFLTRFVFVMLFLFSSITVNASSVINYVPSSASGCIKYDSIVINNDKSVTIACSAAGSGAFTINYVPSSPSGCITYDKLVVAEDKTVNITCGTLFSLSAISSPVTQNSIASFKISRIAPLTGTNSLSLTLSLTGDGYFTDVIGTSNLGKSVTVPFASNEGPDKTLYAKLTSLGTATVSSSSPQISASVTVVAGTVCPQTSVKTIDILGELPLIAGNNVLSGFTNDKRWEIQKGETIAVKFKINIVEPARKVYSFGFYEASPPVNEQKDLALSVCPGVFDGLPANCYMRQITGTDNFALLTSSYSGNIPGCRVSPGGTYYLNMRGAAAGTAADPFLYIKFLMSVGE